MIGKVTAPRKGRSYTFVIDPDGRRDYYAHRDVFDPPIAFDTLANLATVEFEPSTAPVVGSVGNRVAPRALWVRVLDPAALAVTTKAKTPARHCASCQLDRECFPDRASAQAPLVPSQKIYPCSDLWCSDRDRNRLRDARHFHLTEVDRPDRAHQTTPTVAKRRTR